jgi:transcriptional regulator with XRE-family HTH domain
MPARAPTNAALGRATRRLRKHRKLTFETLALDADMHPTYMSGIERGVRNPTWSKLCGLADALAISISAIAAEAEHDTCPVCGALSSE